MRPLLGCLLLAALAGAAAQEAQEKHFVSAWPEKPVVAFGSSIVMNCSTTCKHSGPGNLETNLEKEDAGEGPMWKAFRLVNVSDWNSVPSCFFDCDSNVIIHRVNFTVYRAPARVELDPVPVMEVGKEYTLTCRVPDVAPIRNLSVTFLRGGEELSVQTFEKHAARRPGDVVASHTLTARQADHGEEISCRAALDLRPEGPLFEKASLNHSVRAVVFPGNPELSSPRVMERHTSEMVTCEVSGVFPAEEAQFSLTFAEEKLSLRVDVAGDTARAHAQISPSVAGTHSLTCTVSLGPVTRLVETKVQVYRLPNLTLMVDPREALINETVTLVCSDSHPEDTQPQIFSTRIRNSKGVLGSGHSLPLEVATTVGEEDHGEEFTCELELELNRIRRETSAKLTVYYGPRMNDSSCPSTLTWKAGSEEALSCVAWGNPPPHVECRKDGVLYGAGQPVPVTRDHQGNYSCNASNAYGSVVNIVTVHVEYYEPPLLLIILLCLSLLVIASVAGVSYAMYYKSHKTKEYHLRRKAKGKPSEKKCLNGNIHTDSV